jgi:hypothetical protein
MLRELADNPMPGMSRTEYLVRARCAARAPVPSERRSARRIGRSAAVVENERVGRTVNAMQAHTATDPFVVAGGDR